MASTRLKLFLLLVPAAVLPELPQLEFLPKGDLYLLNQNSPEGGVWGEEGAVVGGGGYFERGDPAATRGQDNFKELWMREYAHG